MPATPFHLVVVLYDNVLSTSVTLAAEMWRTAEAAALGRDRGARRLRIDLVSPGGQPVVTSLGFRLAPGRAMEDIGRCDLVHIPAMWRNPRPVVRRYPQYLPWLRDLAERGALFTSVGTGCCFTAAAGLLDGRPATTHWHYFEGFQRDYPKVDLKRQYFITQSDNFYCAAGLNSMAELMVHLIHRIYGRVVANQVERNFFHEIRNSVEPPRYFAQHVSHHPDEDITQVQIWLQDNFARQVRVGELAEQFNMSVRTLNRRFRSAVGQSPLEYLQEVRLNNARELLKKTNLPIAEIAPLCGYQDAAFFTRLFRKHYQSSPRAYRTLVRAKLFSSEGESDPT